MDPYLRALCYRPSRLGVESAWYGHVPFGYWLTDALRPRQIVELGTHNGVSYSALCDAVLDGGIPARCFAVDTWAGDAHAGFYGSDVYDDFRAFHNARFGGFSTLLRMQFDDALAHFPDGGIDLLHIDGHHTYDAVRHDFDAWRPKLSDRAVVLFHDTNERRDDFGVWRLWHELRGQHPGIEFLHAHGLGVLAVGSTVPPPVADLVGADPSTLAAIRASFAAMGERWRIKWELQAAGHHAARLTEHYEERRVACERAFAEELAQAKQAALDEQARLRAELAEARRQAEGHLGLARDMVTTAGRLRRRTQALQHIIDDQRRSLDAEIAARIARDARQVEPPQAPEAPAETPPARHAGAPPPRVSVARRLATALGRADRRERGAPAPGVSEPAPDVIAPAPEVGDQAPAVPEPLDVAAATAHAIWSDRILRLHVARRALAATPLRVVYLSGEPETPGHTYRVQRFADAAAAAGMDVTVLTETTVLDRLDALVPADILVIWRAVWSETLERVIRLMRVNGTRVVYDIDDLMFDTGLAQVEVIDGIRSMGLRAEQARAHFSSVLAALTHADTATCTTDELAFHLRRHQRPAYVLPNGFDRAAHARSRLAVRRRRAVPSDGMLRLGYAGGSRTHQRDFARAAGAVARVLAERPECRLVLFRSADGHSPLIDVGEYPALLARAAQIEWRDMVPAEALPDELARFDINLAPLEHGNPFCEAKSEIKLFEAALVEVPTVASPTGPFTRALRDGETGLLAADEDAYYAAIVRLLDDPALRARLAHAAYLDALWRWGPERRTQLLAGFFDQMRGGRAAAQAFDLERRRARDEPRPRPAMGEAEVIFARDALGEAAVTVVVPLYNYASYVEEALDSVAAQTEQVIDLVVVDDASTDSSLAVARSWAERNADRFNRLLVLRHRRNAGLGRTRNTGIDAAETPYVLLLDADNRLRPACAARLRAALEDGTAAFAYPAIETFGSERKILSASWFQATRLVGGNYIDAMALIAKPAWAAVGGFAVMETTGWEDYDFWCGCVEAGLWGVAVDEVLADYRVHGQSMLRVTTDAPAQKLRLIAEMQTRHPWLRIPPPE